MKKVDPIMFKVKRSIFFLFITIPLLFSKVEARKIIGNEERVFPILPSHIIEDHEGKYLGKSILNSKEWSVYSTKNKVPNFSFFKGVLWLKYDLYKENNKILYFAIQQPTVGISIFNIYQNNSLIYSDSSGLNIKQSSRKIPNTFPVFIIP